MLSSGSYTADETELLLNGDLTRFRAAQIEGQTLIQFTIAAAKANKIVYSLANLVSSMPTAPSDLRALQT
jgi:hypothetical protein